jgi:hypothetical protein
LTIFHPQTKGGTDDLDNLLYSCNRCNQYKADYWPTHPADPVLWNPRRDPIATHLLSLADGTLYPITPIGSFTLKRLRLNRPPLIAYRLQQQYRAEEIRLLTRYRELVTMLEQLQQQQAALLDEQRTLLENQRALLRLRSFDMARAALFCDIRPGKSALARTQPTICLRCPGLHASA